jgi:hypothetical protein
VVDGDSSGHSWEAMAVEWFNVDQLPKRTLPFAREMIHAARFATERPIKRTQLLPRWQPILLAIGFCIRNLRNQFLSR